MYEHAAQWVDLVGAVHEGSASRVALRLGHAGRRGATRPREAGADRPLRTGGWPLLSASSIPYTRRSQVPSGATHEDLARITDAFVTSALAAAAAGFDLLELDMGSGYLLASFLSPLTNRRADPYGGSAEARCRYPLEVFEMVRRAWPEDRPLAVRLCASDLAPGGGEVDDAIVFASALVDRGCDLVHVVAGQTIEHDRPDFGRIPLVTFADRIRNEAAVPTLVGGGLTTSDQMNTILAAGRADLCLLDPRALS